MSIWQEIHGFCENYTEALKVKTEHFTNTVSSIVRSMPTKTLCHLFRNLKFHCVVCSVCEMFCFYELPLCFDLQGHCRLLFFLFFVLYKGETEFKVSSGNIRVLPPSSLPILQNHQLTSLFSAGCEKQWRTIYWSNVGKSSQCIFETETLNEKLFATFHDTHFIYF